MLSVYVYHMLTVGSASHFFINLEIPQTGLSFMHYRVCIKTLEYNLTVLTGNDHFTVVEYDSILIMTIYFSFIYWKQLPSAEIW